MMMGQNEMQVGMMEAETGAMMNGGMGMGMGMGMGGGLMME